MAYPTAANFYLKPISPIIGLQDLMTTSTTQAHPLGTKVRAIDVGAYQYGESECIYLKGVASTAAGDLVLYDPKAGTTVRAVAASRGPLAVALSANVASQYGWYVVFGQAPVSTTLAGTGAANSGLDTTATDGRATVSAGNSGQKIDGARCKAAQDTPTTGFTQVALSYPAANGNG